MSTVTPNLEIYPKPRLAMLKASTGIDNN